MEFGYHYASFRDDGDIAGVESAINMAKYVEKTCFSWFSFMDHLWQLPSLGYQDENFFDCYTILPAVARETENIQLSALVTCPHYRNPALLGRKLTTLDHISNGRAVLGIGAGWFENEYIGYGYEFPDISTRVSQMEDTIKLVKSMWKEDSPITYNGEHYSIEDAFLEPKPIQDPYPPILVGGNGEKLILKSVARYADEWNGLILKPEELKNKLDVLKNHCKNFDRNYSDIEKTILNFMLIRDTKKEAEKTYKEFIEDIEGKIPREDYYGLVGSPQDIIDQIQKYEDIGTDMIIFLAIQNDSETIHRFCNEIAPKFI